MSKTQLKKELSGYSKEQLIDIILEMYSTRPDVKEYFKFYLNPDSKTLCDKYIKAIDKEFNRSKWRVSKARVSVIKKLIKKFNSFQPDLKYRYDLYAMTVKLSIQTEHFYKLPESLINGICHFINEYLTLADKNEDLDNALSIIGQMVEQDNVGTRYYKNRLAEACQDYVESKSILIAASAMSATATATATA